MGFTHFANTHKCQCPAHRPNGENLAFGDEWQCDDCHKFYRWTSARDQRDENYWLSITQSERSGR